MKFIDYNNMLHFTVMSYETPYVYHNGLHVLTASDLIINDTFDFILLTNYLSMSILQ